MADADPASYAWTSRVLLVFASSAADPSLTAQRRSVAAEAPGMEDRDLVLLTSLGTGQPLRRRYGVAEAGFAVLLIGKDGGVKLRSTQPIATTELFRTIDAMPMRRNEVGRR